jgi:uncharacterized membrane protein
MMNRFVCGGVVLVLVGLTAFLAACAGSSSSSSESAGATGSIPCEVETVLAQRCRECHSAPPKQGAPMALVTYADLVAAARSDPSKHVYDLVEQRIHEDAKPMPPQPSKRLDDQESSALDSWIGKGAHAADTACPAP